VQVDGRMRDRLVVPAGLGRAEAVALATEAPNAARHLDGRPVRRSVHVADRLVNLVTRTPDDG
jgi:leucyl-tRNA synthetase